MSRCAGKATNAFSRRFFEADRERQDELIAIGVEITRVTDLRLEREPEAVMARVRGHLERRRRSLPLRDVDRAPTP